MMNDVVTSLRVLIGSLHILFGVLSGAAPIFNLGCFLLLS